MVIEICSLKRALAETLLPKEKTAVISIASLDERDVEFPSLKEGDERSESDEGNAGHSGRISVLHLKFNDLRREYDEDGIPYGRPLPCLKDFEGLKEFVDGLSCDRLIVHCREGISRSAAVAAAIFEYRHRMDILRTYQQFDSNPLVYSLACRELGILPVRRSFKTIPEGEMCRRLEIRN